MLYPAQAKLLKDVRYTNKLTIKKLAAKLGMNMSRIHRLECGKADITFKEAIVFQKEFGAEIFNPIFTGLHLVDCYKSGGRGKGKIREVVSVVS